MNIYLKYLIEFLLLLGFVYLFYFLMIVYPQLSYMRKKEKGKKTSKEKKYPADLILLQSYYKINIEKIGIIRVLRILNLVSSIVLAIFIMAIMELVPLKQVWSKIVFSAVLILPLIWFTYYFVAKYLKHLERKYKNE